MKTLLLILSLLLPVTCFAVDPVVSFGGLVIDSRVDEFFEVFPTKDQKPCDEMLGHKLTCVVTNSTYAGQPVGVVVAQFVYQEMKFLTMNPTIDATMKIISRTEADLGPPTEIKRRTSRTSQGEIVTSFTYIWKSPVAVLMIAERVDDTHGAIIFSDAKGLPVRVKGQNYE